MERVVCKPLPLARLRQGLVVQPPLAGPKTIRQDSQAIGVVTDLRQIAGATIRGSAKDPGLDGNLIAPTKLQQIAAKPAK